MADQTDYNVLVTILTDGEENASKEYNGRTIKQLIEDLKAKGWTFTYIGANQDVEKVGATLSITNTLSFQANEADMQQMFAKEKRARMNYSAKLSRNEQVSENYYDEETKA